METGPESQPEDADGSITPAEIPSRHLAANLWSYQSWSWSLLSFRTLQLLSSQMARHKDSDIIGVHRYFCQKRASKRNVAQGWAYLLIPKPMEQRLQSKDIEKRWGNPARPTAWLWKSPSFSCSLHHCLRVIVHHANPFVELWFKSSGFQNICQKPMVNTIKGLELIQID